MFCIQKKQEKVFVVHLLIISKAYEEPQPLGPWPEGPEVEYWNVAKDVEIAAAPLGEGEASNELRYCCNLNNESLEQALPKQLA
jgi:hypothetical protein